MVPVVGAALVTPVVVIALLVAVPVTRETPAVPQADPPTVFPVPMMLDVKLIGSAANSAEKLAPVRTPPVYWLIVKAPKPDNPVMEPPVNVLSNTESGLMVALVTVAA